MLRKQEEWQRYRRQAEHTLSSAGPDRKAGDHDWACFKAQQAGGLAPKGYIRAAREYVTGHSVTRLLGGVGQEVPDELVGCARDLDKVYIPARYPDAYDSGAPMDYYGPPDSEKAIRCAARILRWLDDRAAAQSS
jgi:HEPN domain-containing protein